jgi:hypothetical protein
MMRRFAAVGDALQNGGAIQPYSGPSFTFGEAKHQAALIGGQAYCEACKSTGRIAKAGGPRRMKFMGEVALAGDVVLCKCPRPPRVVATLAGEAYFDDMGRAEERTESGESGPGPFAKQSEDFDELVVAHTSEGPIADYPYFVETSDGRSLFGHTDEQGRLPRIVTMAAGSLTVYWGDVALAKHLGDHDA